MKRYKVNRRSDRKRFSRTAGHTNYKNLLANPMRGGYRL